MDKNVPISPHSWGCAGQAAATILSLVGQFCRGANFVGHDRGGNDETLLVARLRESSSWSDVDKSEENVCVCGQVWWITNRLASGGESQGRAEAMNREILKQALGGAVGAILVAVVFAIASDVRDGGLVETMGGLTEAKLQESPTIAGMRKKVQDRLTKGELDESQTIVAIKENIKAIEEDFTSNRRAIRSNDVQVTGESPWGSWHQPSYCPIGYYVCGIAMKVEAPLGEGDDTAVNGLALRCCRFLQSKSK